MFKQTNMKITVSSLIVLSLFLVLLSGLSLAGKKPCIYTVSDDYTVKKIMPNNKGPWAGEELDLYGMDQELTAIEVDNDGNLYIGMADTVRKISPSGEKIWENRRMGDWVQDLALGPDGSVYAAGENDGGLKKLSPEGKEEWEIEEKKEIFNGYIGLFVLAVETDQEGSVYASFGNEIKKLTPSGDEIWSYNEFNGKIRDIEIGPDGNIYGASQGGIIRKLSPDGEILWSYEGRNELNAIAVDGEGNVYCGGGHLRDRSYISKVTPAGREEWLKKDFFYMILCAASDNNHNIYFGADKLMRISPDGKITWQYTGHTDRIMGLAVGTAAAPDYSQDTAVTQSDDESIITVSSDENTAGNTDDVEDNSNGIQNENTQSVDISTSCSSSDSEDIIESSSSDDSVNVSEESSSDSFENNEGNTGETGDIQISTAPGLLVYVDGQFKTKTSADFGGAYLEGLPVGKHEIKVVKEGFNARTFNVFIKEDKTLLLEVKNLTPKIKVRQEGEEKSGEVEAKVGKITIRTIPIDCRIGVMGQTYNKQKDKFIMEDVPYGQYKFSFAYKGRRIEYNLNLNSENTLLKVDFRKEKVFINRSPEIIAAGKQTADQGSLLKVNLSALDPDNDELEFSITDIRGPEADEMANILKKEHSHLKLERLGADSVRLIWNTENAAPGIYRIQYLAADDNFSDSGELVVKVEENIPPEISLDYSLRHNGQGKGAEKVLQVSGGIEDRDDKISRVIFEWGDGRSAAISEAFDKIKLSHQYDDYGSYRINIVVVYVSGKEVSRNKRVKVKNNPPQVGKIEARSVLAGDSLDFDIHLDDPEGDEFNLILTGDLKKGKSEFESKLKNIPAEMQLKRIDDNNYRFSWKTDRGDTGTHEIMYRVEDGYNTETGRFKIEVSKNAPPEVQLDVSNKQKEVVIKGEAVDPEGQMKEITVEWGDGRRETFKSGDFDPGDLSLRHQYDEYGEYNITVTAWDKSQLKTTLTKNVQLKNHPPEINTFKNITGCVGLPIEFKINTYDNDGDDLEVSIDDVVFSTVYDIKLVKLDNNTTLFKWNPGRKDSGQYQVPIKVTDSKTETCKIINIDIKNKITSVKNEKIVWGEEAAVKLSDFNIEGTPTFKLLKFINSNNKNIISKTNDNIKLDKQKPGIINLDSSNFDRGNYELFYEVKNKNQYKIGSMSFNIYIKTTLEKKVYPGKKLAFSINANKFFSFREDDIKMDNIKVISQKLPKNAEFNNENLVFSWNVPDALQKDKYYVILKASYNGMTSLKKIQLTKSKYKGIYKYKQRPYKCDAGGKLKWSYRVGAIRKIIDSPDGTIYVRSNTNLIALTSSGKKKWEKEKIIYSTNQYSKYGPGPYLTPANNIVIMNKNGYLQTINDKGEILWQLKLNKDIRYLKVLNNGLIVAGDNQNTFLISENGKIKWQKNFKQIETWEIGNDGTIYIAAGKEGLHALNLKGKIKYKYNYNFGHYIFYSKLDDVLYSIGEKLYAFRENGDIKWTKYFYGSAYHIQAYEDYIYLLDSGFDVDGDYYEDRDIYRTNDGEHIWNDSDGLLKLKGTHRVINYDKSDDDYLGKILVDGQNRIAYTFQSNDYEIEVDCDLNIYKNYLSFNDKLIKFNSKGEKEWVFDIGENARYMKIGANGLLYLYDRGRHKLLAIR